MNRPPPPQDNDPIITQFKPANDQWELTDVNLKRISHGDTILHNYCQHINTTPLELYRYLIEVKGCDVNAQNSIKITPVQDALHEFNPHHGDFTVLIYLLTHEDVNVNIQDFRDANLLHKACEKINVLPLDVFKLLIELKGADVNATNKYYNTPIDSALRSFNQTQGGDIAVLTYLLNQENVDVNLKRQFGHTILHAACQHINTLTVDTFKVLIETKHGDINVQNDNKSTPLHTALHFFQQSQGDDITLLNYLLSHKEVNVSIKDQCGYTVLHQACLCESNIPLDIFKYLIEIKGADVNARDNFGNVPIHTAFLHFKPNAAGDITTLDYLLNQTDFNVRGRNGRNVLHLACTCGLTGPWGSSVWAIDAMWARVIEMIAERCVKLVLDGVAL